MALLDRIVHGSYIACSEYRAPIAVFLEYLVQIFLIDHLFRQTVRRERFRELQTETAVVFYQVVLLQIACRVEQRAVKGIAVAVEIICGDKKVPESFGKTCLLSLSVFHKEPYRIFVGIFCLYEGDIAFHKLMHPLFYRCYILVAYICNFGQSAVGRILALSVIAIKLPVESVGERIFQSQLIFIAVNILYRLLEQERERAHIGSSPVCIGYGQKCNGMGHIELEIQRFQSVIHICRKDGAFNAVVAHFICVIHGVYQLQQSRSRFTDMIFARIAAKDPYAIHISII